MVSFLCGQKRTAAKYQIIDLILAKLEKNIALEIVNNEINVENDVTKKLSIILDNHITTIQKQKRIVAKLMQDNESAKHKYQVKFLSIISAPKTKMLNESSSYFAGRFAHK